ncbi:MULTISPECIES: metallophosphoesterase [Paraliobacillus]|uniref:metallophosphoesterase n=1 Tax=Paraliobacillus TaxID=200903 RepID=UPI000DD3CB82|nr:MULTISPECIES: metallophosphoesterase [Paraliobacillus]
MDKIKQITIPDHARIIVVSDIHGELELLTSVLEKVSFSSDDYLIINGDLCEKGSNSSGVVSYVMQLTEANDKVHVTEGNCDSLVEELLNESPTFIDYLRFRPQSIFNEWLKQIGYSIHDNTTVQEVKELLIPHFKDEIKWLVELPTAIETREYLFVHAGIENKSNWQETDREMALTMQAFLEKEHQAEQFVIVGHWPVSNYKSNIEVNNPIINYDKKMIAIDGGNIIKDTGQLNVFIIDRQKDGDIFSYSYVDRFPISKVLADFYSDGESSGVINYPYYQVKPIEVSIDFTLCEQVKTSKLLLVKNEYLKQADDSRYFVKTDLSCAQLSVKKGDKVAIIDDTCSGYILVKKDGIVGWISKNVI